MEVQLLPYIITAIVCLTATAILFLIVCCILTAYEYLYDKANKTDELRIQHRVQKYFDNINKVK